MPGQGLLLVRIVFPKPRIRSLFLPAPGAVVWTLRAVLERLRFTVKVWLMVFHDRILDMAASSLAVKNEELRQSMQLPYFKHGS